MRSFWTKFDKFLAKKFDQNDIGKYIQFKIT